MTKRNIRAITYPSDQEDNGTVVIGWQGPSSVNEYYQLVILLVLVLFSATFVSMYKLPIIDEGDIYVSASIMFCGKIISTLYLQSTFDNSNTVTQNSP